MNGTHRRLRPPLLPSVPSSAEKLALGAGSASRPDTSVLTYVPPLGSPFMTPKLWERAWPRPLHRGAEAPKVPTDSAGPWRAMCMTVTPPGCGLCERACSSPRAGALSSVFRNSTAGLEASPNPRFLAYELSDLGAVTHPLCACFPKVEKR